MKYERLTIRVNGYAHGKKGRTVESALKSNDFYRGKFECTGLVDRLAELEDKIENGTLVELPLAKQDKVYHLINRGKRGYYIKPVMWKSYIWAFLTYGHKEHYYSTREEAIEKRKQLTEKE